MDIFPLNHSEHSALRELIVEHLFIGKALRRLWCLGIADVEILRSEKDLFGYDLVMTRGKITRHVQLKTSRHDGKADAVKINLELGKKPSGCVIWILINPELTFNSFLWFGGKAGDPLPDIQHNPVAKHTKGDSQGEKNERPNHREVKRGKFEKLNSMDDVLQKLLGALVPS